MKYSYLLDMIATDEGAEGHLKQINRLAKDGWELVTALHPTHSSYIWYYYRRAE